MRWIWIDRFTEFVSGSHATAVKSVTLAEDFLRDHLPGYPIFPPSLVIEGMAQTAGVLVGEAKNFEENVVLAKIRSVSFTDYAVPGDQLRYQAKIDSVDDHAAVTKGEVFLNDHPIGNVNLIFSHLNNSDQVDGLPDHNFVFTKDFLRLFNAIRHHDDRGSAT